MPPTRQALDRRDPVATQAIKENIWLRKQVAFLEAECKKANRGADVLSELLAERDAQIARLTADGAVLTNEVRALRAGKASSADSTNSSMPPSSDPPRTRAQRRAKARALAKSRAQECAKSPGGATPQGAQPGHVGTHRARAIPTDSVEHRPETCTCGEDLSEEPGQVMATRQVIDLPLLAAVITDHYRVKVRCKKCRRVTKGEWGPGSGTAPVTFGNGIRAHAVWLHDRHGVPVDRVAEIIGELTGITPSPGSILAWQAGVARSLRDYEARAALALLAADVVHADESGVGIGLEEKWIHVAATDTVVKYHVGNRGHEGVEAGEILDKTTAAVCSDDYATYTKYEEGWAAHLPCWAHWLRRLDRVAGLSGCKWAEELATEMRGAIHSANEARDRGRPWVSTREQQRVAARLTKLCAAGKKACAPNTADTGDNAVLRRRGLLLAKTIGSHDHALAFMADLSKPATNNAAEQALRYPKVILRGKAGWRSESAVEHKLVIAGYLETAARGGIDRLVALKDALSGTPYLPALV